MKIYSPDLIGTTTATGSVIATLGFTGSLQGTASFATTASFALNGGGGNSGLISGSAPNTLISTFYTAVNAISEGTGSIVIGNSASAPSVTSINNVVIGTNATSKGNSPNNVIIGYNAQTIEPNRDNAVIIGANAKSYQEGVAIGANSQGFYRGLGIGRNAQAGANYAIAIGGDVTASFENSIVIGQNISSSAANEINIGGVIRFNGTNTVILNYATQISGGLDVTGSVTGNAIGNNTDTYTSSAAIQQIVSLTQAEYNAISGSANSNTLYVISGSTPLNITYATTGSNTFIGNQVISGSLTVSGSTVLSGTTTFSGSATFLQSTVLSGSIRGEVNALSIASNTASLDCSLDNFFTLQLVSGSNTFINPSNILPGQTINLRINTTGSGTVSFPSSVKQVSGSSYVPTTTTGVDIVTFISFDSSDLYLSNVKNLV
jgi:hypothetical protein